MHLPSTTVQAFLQLCGRLTRLHVTTSRFPDRGDDSQDIDWLEGKKTGGAVLGGRKDRESFPLPMMSKGEIVERFVIDVKARARPRSNGQLSLFVLFVDGNFGMTKQHQRPGQLVHVIRYLPEKEIIADEAITRMCIS